MSGMRPVRDGMSDGSCFNEGRKNKKMRIVLLGNAGAGKSTMAKRLIRNANIPRLSLDEIAWNEGTQRKPLAESIRELEKFLSKNGQWIVEGCYGDLVEVALPRCAELGFLNPGIEVCVEHCRKRPWEPEKFASMEEQQALMGIAAIFLLIPSCRRTQGILVFTCILVFTGTWIDKGLGLVAGGFVPSPLHHVNEYDWVARGGCPLPAPSERSVQISRTTLFRN